MIMAIEITDVISLFGEYAQMWSNQQGGGHSRISLVLPGYESYALSRSKAETKYYPPTNQTETAVAISSNTYTNTGKHPKEICLTLEGETDNWAKFVASVGASAGGKRLLDIDMPTDVPAFLVNQSAISLPLGDDTLTISERQTWAVNHPFTIRPRFKVKATLMVKKRNWKRCFDIKHTLSGYIGVITSQPINGKFMSLHHVARILERYDSPYFEVNGEKVTIFANGMLTASYALEPYIHIVAESLDIPGLVEEYDIYNPQTDQNVIPFEPSQPIIAGSVSQEEVVTMGSSNETVMSAPSNYSVPTYQTVPMSSSNETAMTTGSEICSRESTRKERCGCLSCMAASSNYPTQSDNMYTDF